MFKLIILAAVLLSTATANYAMTPQNDQCWRHPHECFPWPGPAGECWKHLYGCFPEPNRCPIDVIRRAVPPCCDVYTLCEPSAPVVQ